MLSADVELQEMHRAGTYRSVFFCRIDASVPTFAFEKHSHATLAVSRQLSFSMVQMRVHVAEVKVRTVNCRAIARNLEAASSRTQHYESYLRSI